MPSFKNGDRVIVVNGYIDPEVGDISGRIGTIIDPRRILWTDDISIEFDEDIKGGNCNGRGRSGHCLFLDIRLLIPYKKGCAYDSMYAEGYSFKIIEKVKVRQHDKSPTGKRHYYIITTLYSLIPKGNKRHFRIFETDKLFKNRISVNPSEFDSVEDARKYLETFGTIVK